MARESAPYHSIDGEVYHIYSDCTVGNNIERDKMRSGKSGRRLCSVCKDIRDGKRKR